MVGLYGWTFGVQDFGSPLGPYGGSCAGVCEVVGLSCVRLELISYIETEEMNICNVLYPDLPAVGDGDGPRLRDSIPDGPIGADTECVYRSYDWVGWSCSMTGADTDTRICPCE